MLEINDLRNVFRHMGWADATVWRSVFKLPRAADDGQLRELLYHIHAAQHAFLRIWSGLSMDGFPEAATFEDLESICRWGREGHESLHAYLDRIGGADPGGNVDLPWSEQVGKRLGIEPKPVTLAQTMLQVNFHSAYHRGQVNARLRKLEGEPPMVDFIAWIWLGEPAADWPAPP